MWPDASYTKAHRSVPAQPLFKGIFLVFSSAHLSWKKKKGSEKRRRLPVICIMANSKGSYFWEGIMAPTRDAGGLVKEKPWEPKEPHISLKCPACLWRKSWDQGDNTALRREPTLGAAEQSSPWQNDSGCPALHSKCVCVCVCVRERECTDALLNSLSLCRRWCGSVAMQGFQEGRKDDAICGRHNAIRANQSTGKVFQDTRKRRGRVSGSRFSSPFKAFFLLAM